ncbi:MAG: hypothetical protein LBC18_02850 [Opitutaceae bacterium]|nr:hypothetical protein [Opitutaceae bacterium]
MPARASREPHFRFSAGQASRCLFIRGAGLYYAQTARRDGFDNIATDYQA